MSIFKGVSCYFRIAPVLVWKFLVAQSVDSGSEKSSRFKKLLEDVNINTGPSNCSQPRQLTISVIPTHDTGHFNTIIVQTSLSQCSLFTVTELKGQFAI